MLFFFFSFGFISKAVIALSASRILMSVKYVSAHASWVGASTKANTVGCCCVFTDIPRWAGVAKQRLAHCPRSRRGERETEGGRERGHKARERRREKERNHPIPIWHRTLFILQLGVFPLDLKQHTAKQLLDYPEFLYMARSLMSFGASAEMLWGDKSNQDPRGFIFIWHGSWNRVLSVSKPVLLHGFSTGRTLW